MSTPHKCPACDGWGERSKFTAAQVDTVSTYPPYTDVECHACDGTGVLWEQSEPIVANPVHGTITVGDPPNMSGLFDSTSGTVTHDRPQDQWSYTS